MSYETIARQGENRFLIVDAEYISGETLQDGAMCRIVDTQQGTMSDTMPVASVMAHSPGWTDRTQVDESFPDIDELLEMVDMESVPSESMEETVE
ncbi:hypothetical protein [Halanaeroarchaeum sulfurireducens]|uniref:Uncharacterized protein n=1 Tax=Halanaeroarchaeum sulfurireducens TaxID=1604004 RepID=A0A0F7PGM4_9EURY|nr:hypothetical protein [Halanaeroarchaeum sulfurireducens]AKH98709.1 hypothetical protein HLASF_3083 [Halanaeroarchaeum sulfurireducens]ALG83153.1 hypothetical protein HLASA_3085 [Halanaeroarchaeum sulfurireducens]